MRFVSGTHVIEVNTASEAALLRAVTQRFERGEGFSVATVNLDHLVKMTLSETFCAAYEAQDFVVADGNPIVWLSRLARRPVSLAPGSDLVIPLARRAAQAGVCVGLVGSTAASLQAAADVLRHEVPEIAIVAQIAPRMGFDPLGPEADRVFEELDAARAGLVFLALGAPKQEILGARGRMVVPHMGFACIGAGLDFLAGSQRRAPRWMRRFALEWLWRMLSNPRRLVARYMASLAIIPSQVFAALRLR